MAIKNYEVRVLTKREDVINDTLQEVQDQGWKIAGDILLRMNSNNDGVLYASIPMKRLLKEKDKK